MEEKVTNSEMKRLRELNLLSKDEIALKIGDKVVAENIITRTRRVLELSNFQLSETKRLLLG